MDYAYRAADPSLYTLLKDFAKNNRKFPTEAEMALWSVLKANQLGVPFKRQHIIGPFIADFACLPAHLVIEIDGGYHQLPEMQTSDQYRTEWLTKQGFQVVRFSNEEVLFDINNVINNIKEYIQ